MVPFVSSASVCRSLQCLISALRQVGGGGLLFRFAWCCGEGGALQTNVTGMCGEHWQCSGHTGFAPACRVCFPHLHCSGSRLLSRERALSCMHFPGLRRSDSGFWVLHQDRLSWACVLCFPHPSSSGSQELDGCALPGAVRLIPLQPQPQFPSAGRVGLVSVLGRWTLATTLPANVDHPESPEVIG